MKKTGVCRICVHVQLLDGATKVSTLLFQGLYRRVRLYTHTLVLTYVVRLCKGIKRSRVGSLLFFLSIYLLLFLCVFFDKFDITAYYMPINDTTLKLSVF